MYKLLEMLDGNEIREHPLSGSLFRVGRNPGNHLQPDDASISGNHAAITLIPIEYLDGAQHVIIEDCNSTNGTWVNGKRVKQQRLKHGDLLTIGSLSFKLVDDQALAVGQTRILIREEEG
jgi:pSer/pThr/pTyr-binding forkhead associated (FHA) protein